MSSQPVDLGWIFVSDVDRRRQLATWWPHDNDDTNQHGHLVVDGPAGIEALGETDLTTARLLVDDAATVTRLRHLTQRLRVQHGPAR